MFEMSMHATFFVTSDVKVRIEEIQDRPGKLVMSFNDDGRQYVSMHVTPDELPRLARILVEAVARFVAPQRVMRDANGDVSFPIPDAIREVVRNGCGPMSSTDIKTPVVS